MFALKITGYRALAMGAHWTLCGEVCSPMQKWKKLGPAALLLC
jgi:hypothetical protein